MEELLQETTYACKAKSGLRKNSKPILGLNN